MCKSWREVSVESLTHARAVKCLRETGGSGLGGGGGVMGGDTARGGRQVCDEEGGSPSRAPAELTLKLLQLP